MAVANVATGYLDAWIVDVSSGEIRSFPAGGDLEFDRWKVDPRTHNAVHTRGTEPVQTAEGNPDASAACGAPEAGAREVQVARDAYVGSSYQQRGSRGAAELSFGGWGDYYYAYIQFELPAGTPKQAILCLYATNVPPNDPQLQLAIVTSAWNPDALTIATRPTHQVAKEFGRVLPGWNAVDVSDVVRAWTSGAAQNFGIALLPGANNQTNGAFAGSLASDTDHRPKLRWRP